jgi:hypothetical protein
MKTSYNPEDGLYIILLIILLAISLWVGDRLRIKIRGSNLNHKLAVFTGVFVEILITITGLVIGFLLIVFLAPNT